MSTDLQPYPAYKPSGIDWLGDVPAHWDVRRIKTLFRETDDRSSDGSGELLSLTRARGLIPQAEASNRIASVSDLSNYKICRPGLLVMNRMQAWSGMFAVPTMTGLVSPDYCVFQPIDKCDVKYFEYLFKTQLLIGQFAQRSKGIGSGFNRLYTPDFGSIPIMYPPLAEQAAIARYLDRADERISRAISVKQRLVELLTEQRQAVIHRAVTRGLDADAPLKASGIDWLGDVPAHWDVRRLKQVASLNPSRTEARAILNDNVPVVFLPMEKVETDGCVDESEIRLAHEVWNGFTYFKRGDVIVAKITPCFENGKGAYLGSLRTDIGFGSTEFHVLRANHSVIPQFLYLLTTNYEFRKQGTDAMTGAAGQQRVPASFVANYRIPVPPLAEQTAIVRHLDKATADIDAAMENARRTVELLGEYRARLVADAVTGRVDVRGRERH